MILYALFFDENLNRELLKLLKFEMIIHILNFKIIVISNSMRMYIYDK